MKFLSAAEVKATNPFIQTLQLGFSLLSFLRSSDYPPQASVHDGQSFDFVIVGGGTAGCVLASRLAESNYNVLLVEAGDDPPLLSDTPSTFLIADSEPIDWGYYSENDGYTSQAHKTKTVRLVRGKMLSGSNGNNYLYYTRGNKADYDRWARGNPGWDWNTMLHYFKKSESLQNQAIMNSETGRYHGAQGNIALTQQNWEKYTKVYLDAFRENGRKVVEDNVGYQQVAYSLPMYTVHDGQRQSTAHSYLKPVKDRQNLFVLKNTRALRVILQNRRAVGVLVKLPDGSLAQIGAIREVILSAGAINTPQLLMLSGVGPRQHLAEMGIPVVLDSPNVGQNLQDHVTVPIVLTGKRGLRSAFKNFAVLSNWDKVPSASILGFAAVGKTRTVPDYEATIFPTPAFSTLPTLTKACQFSENLFSILSMLHPRSRGEIKLKSSNPEEAPRIYTRYFSDPRDLDRFAYYIEDYLTILNSTYFKRVKSKVVDMKLKECEEFAFGSHVYWKCFVLNVAMTSGDLVGTCAMGPAGVVDYKLRVNGLQRLRIVDASIMPDIISGNVNAAVVAIAEKAFDMIQQDIMEASMTPRKIQRSWQLAPIRQDYPFMSYLRE